MEFKDILKEKREATGLNKIELGEALGLKRGNIDKYEKGETRPTMDTLIKMSAFFGCTVDELLGLSTIRLEARPGESGDTIIKLGLKELRLEDFDEISLKDLDRLLSYIEHKLGIELRRFKK